MIPGLTGSLLSHEALGGVIPDAIGTLLDVPGGRLAQQRMRAWHGAVRNELGPASAARAVFDRLAVPLAEALGFSVTLRGSERGHLFRAVLAAGGTPRAGLVVSPWGQDPAGAWRDAVRHGIGNGLHWCWCITGPRLRVLDARRTYSRRFIEFDIDAALDDPRTFAVLWGLLRAAAFAAEHEPGSSLLDRAVALSEHHRAAVRVSLQEGVHDALCELVRAFASPGRRGASPSLDRVRVFDESLTVVYRVLFLLFAEARGLVPTWHPTYRDSYTIEALRPSVEQRSRPSGLWESLQAIARLAHQGCTAGTLRVAPFNGRLFSPVHAPLADSIRLDDGAVRSALLSLTTRPGRTRRERIAYGDLGVEQLGGVYERVLDFEVPRPDDIPRAALVRVGRRKATGSFYTPRSLTEYVVRRTLAPLTQEATPEQILSLRILDPAMGSGAFLVAACRFMAAAYESALVREGAPADSDIGDPERAGFRRLVAQRCLFGVDINPMAVQLGRLSLWLATLAGDRPLTFLDHHLRTGNSLVGASLEDVARQPPSRRGGRGVVPLPLFDPAAIDGAIGATVGPRTALALGAGDTLNQVRAKEHLLASLARDDAPLARWKSVADLWCAGWFDDRSRAPGPLSRPGAYGALADEILQRAFALPAHVSQPLLEQARTVAARERFFHWPLEFPEVFYADDGLPLGKPGFDAVITNPPWEVLRGDRGSEADRRAASDASARLTGFARGSGVYAFQGDGHSNLYQLFVERALSLVKSAGRLGLILPSGFASDHGCAALRRHALDRCGLDTFVSLENRDGVFPIHRGLKFLLITASTGTRTTLLPCRFGVRQPDDLDRVPDAGPDEAVVTVPRGLVERLTGAQLAIPELRTVTDVTITEKIAFSVPLLGDARGWDVKFARELNATDDRRHFTDVRSPHGARDRLLPVIEGKQIQPFSVDLEASRFWIRARTAATLLDPERTYRRSRLAYRDVASATNRLTLIAAILPAGVVTTHTLFCLKDGADEQVHLFLCGVFNSFVANYLVRQRVNTHVTLAIIERLPVPRPPRDGTRFRRMTALGARLTRNPHDSGAAAAQQALAAHLYGLGAAEFRHVLDTFPLIPAAERAAAMDAFLDAI